MRSKIDTSGTILVTASPHERSSPSHTNRRITRNSLKSFDFQKNRGRAARLARSVL